MRDQLERHPMSFSYYKKDFKQSDMIPEEEEDEIYEPLDPDGNLTVSQNKSLTTTLPLPPVPENFYLLNSCHNSHDKQNSFTVLTVVMSASFDLLNNFCLMMINLFLTFFFR